MNKIKFLTSDGEIFDIQLDAERYQELLDLKLKSKKSKKKKKRKKCSICGGTGGNPYYSSHVGGSEPGCPACGGSGKA